MEKKTHVLVLTHYYPPEVNAPANRIFDHVSIWTDNHLEITVITNNPSHPHGRLYEGFNNEFSDSKSKEIRLIRLKTYLAPNAGFYKRIINYLNYMWRAIIKGRQIKNVDFVFATSPQFFCGLGGAILSKVMNKPFVIEIRDIWPESIIALGMLKNKNIIGLLKFLEKWMINSAYRIIAVTKGIEKHISSLTNKKILYIPNGVRIKENREITFNNEQKDKMVFAYIGTLGISQNVNLIINVARNLLSNNNVHFFIVGDGSERDNILQSAKDLNNVKFFPLLSRSSILKLYDSIDVGIVTLKNNTLFKGALPSKMFEYLAMGKPVVLNAPEGEASKLLVNHHCGIVTKPDDIDQFSSALIKYANQADLYNNHSYNGRILVNKYFNRNKLALELMEVFHA